MTPRSLNKNVVNTVAGASDIAQSGGILLVNGAPSISRNKIVSARWMPGYAGQGQSYLLTTATPVIGTTYSFQIVQTIGQQDVVTVITVVSSTTVPATFYAAVEAAVNASGRFEGTVSSSASGVVLTGSVNNPFFTVTTITNSPALTVPFVTGANTWTVANNAITASPSGVTVSTGAGAPTTLAFGAALTGRVVGGLYRVSLSGFAGADAAALNGRTVYGVLTTSTAMSLFIDTATLTITLGSGLVTFLPNKAENYADSFGKDTVTGDIVENYIPTNNYLGLEVVYYNTGDPGEANLRLNPSANQTLFITNNSAANLCAAYLGAPTAVGTTISGTL